MKPCLELGPLTAGRLIRRYQRFLADVKLKDGAVVTAHCPNTGAMTGCMQSGGAVWLSQSANPKRKYAYTWELAQMPDTLVGINTLNANRLVKQALTMGAVPEITTRGMVKPEAKVGASRLDFMIDGPEAAAYIEVKNCTLVRDGVAAFPDVVTLRGQKHLQELMALAARGCEAVIFYLVQRMDARVFKPAYDIDAEYARLLQKAYAAGVKIVAYDTEISPGKVVLGRSLPFDLTF